ncbi:MAG TPA: hypothetical protein VHZ51_10790 [Ktedonobacteraceae bacterium]|nr:hypothetical protein [Ktedonobacteraceae bacterium]
MWSRPLPEGAQPSSVTVTKDRAGRYFISILMEETIATLPLIEKMVGVDLGLPFAAEGPCIHAWGWKPRRRQAEKTLDRNSHVWYVCSNKAP